MTRDAGAYAIIVTNVAENEVLPHALVLLEGFVRDFSALALPSDACVVDARLDAARGAFWPVTPSGRFKALVLLPAPGRFAISLRVGGLVRVCHVEFYPPVSRFVVKFYYQKCADAGDAAGFDAPHGTDNSDAAAIDKIRLTALLLQTATAEMFRHAGLPRRCFAVEPARDGLPLVHMLRSRFPTSDARRIHDQELIKRIEQDIVAFGMDAHDEHEFKHAVILGCSTWNPSTHRAEGHTALGGGKVGIFGSCGLHTWPRHLGEITACCLNNARIDTRVLMDDSGNRGTFWANFSTGIGAFIHELGHTFGLGHSTSGIMSRGFDDMTRLFSAYEPDHRAPEPGFFHAWPDGRLQLNHRVLREVDAPNGAHWNTGAALQLVHCPWISARAKQSTCGPSVCWSKSMRGPVGHGTYDGAQHPFVASPHGDHDVGAVLVQADEFLEQISTYSRAHVAQMPDHELRSSGNKQLIILMPSEYITKVEVRAMAWIDGVRIHTNRRATRWFGGFGGQLHVLQPDPGHHICGFFGSHGDTYVGRLGVRCAPTTTAAKHGEVIAPRQRLSIPHPDTLHTVPKVGPGKADGKHSSFSFRDSPIGAIAIKCDEFIESIRVVTPELHERETTNETGPALYASGEHVFELLGGEVLERVHVRGGHWLDAVRFETNLRKSAWFGGAGGERSDTLAVAPGDMICGLYGTKGKTYVDTLGAYACSRSSVVPTLTRTIGPAGLADQDGVQRAFHTDPASAREVELGAILVNANDFVHAVWTYTHDEVRAMPLSELESRDGRFWFVLAPGEFVTHVEVRAMCWVDGVRFHTNKRSSEWFGGRGGQVQLLQPPSGYKIHGLFGSVGDHYLGKLGAYCSLIASPPTTGTPKASRVASAVTTFSVCSDQSSTQRAVASPHAGVARGVLIAVQQGRVMYVSSFDTAECKTRLVQDLQVFLYGGAELHSFTFQPGEFLVQVDASFNRGVHPPAVEGVCVHTSMRCSSWFGAYVDSQLVFSVAPSGQVLKSVASVAGASSIVDLVGEICSCTDARASGPSSSSSGSPAPPHVREDPGAYDVRVQAQSPLGVQSVVLLRRGKDEDLDHHAWAWPHAYEPCPQQWCLPQQMLEYHITDAAAGQSRRHELFTRYAVGAVDAGGAYSMAACPPA